MNHQLTETSNYFTPGDLNVFQLNVKTSILRINNFGYVNLFKMSNN